MSTRKISAQKLKLLLENVHKRRPNWLIPCGSIAKDIADPARFTKKELLMGVNEEMEHTCRPMLALLIALDHLDEDERYYTKLKQIKKIKLTNS